METIQTNIVMNKKIIAKRLTNLVNNDSNIKNQLERELFAIENTCGFKSDDIAVEGFRTIYDSYKQGLFTREEELNDQVLKYRYKYLTTPNQINQYLF